MLLPLTSAVYVPGKLASHDSILLDIGTGYFAEVSYLLLQLTRSTVAIALCDILCAMCGMQRTPSQGADYCKRKVNMLRDNLDKIGQVGPYTCAVYRVDNIMLQ